MSFQVRYPCHKYSYYFCYLFLIKLLMYFQVNSVCYKCYILATGGVPQQFCSAFQYDVVWVKCFIHEFKNVLITPNFVRLMFDILQAIHVTLTHAAMVVSVLLIVCQGLHAFVQSASLERLATFVSNSY